MRRYKFCDLDGTIIFSKRYNIENKVLVELFNNEPISYMEKEAYEILQCIPKEEFIPLTSRTKEQYGRLKLFRNNAVPVYSLLDNGGILLVNGVEDQKWTQDTKCLISDELKLFSEIIEVLENVGSVKIQDEMVLFLKTKDNIGISDIEKLLSVYPEIQVFQHGKKIYVCSSKLNKGYAIERFRKRYGYFKTIGAGDSVVDLAMLDYVDAFIGFEELGNKIGSDYSDKVNLYSATDLALNILKY